MQLLWGCGPSSAVIFFSAKWVGHKWLWSANIQRDSAVGSYKSELPAEETEVSNILHHFLHCTVLLTDNPHSEKLRFSYAVEIYFLCFPPLTFCRVDGWKLTEKHFEDLVTAVQHMVSLTELDLSDSHMDLSRILLLNAGVRQRSSQLQILR